MPAADIVEVPVVGLADQGVDRLDRFISGAPESVLDDGGRRLRHGQGVGQDDRRFDGAQLLDLSDPMSLPNPLATATAPATLS